MRNKNIYISHSRGIEWRIDVKRVYICIYILYIIILNQVRAIGVLSFRASEFLSALWFNIEEGNHCSYAAHIYTTILCIYFSSLSYKFILSFLFLFHSVLLFYVLLYILSRQAILSFPLRVTFQYCHLAKSNYRTIIYTWNSQRLFYYLFVFFFFFILFFILLPIYTNCFQFNLFQVS